MGSPILTALARAVRDKPISRKLQRELSGSIQMDVEMCEAVADAAGFKLRVRQVGKPHPDLPRSRPAIVGEREGVHWVISLFRFHANRHGIASRDAARFAGLSGDVVMDWIFGVPCRSVIDAEALLATVGLAFELRQKEPEVTIHHAACLTGLPKRGLRKAGFDGAIPLDKLAPFVDRLPVHTPEAGRRVSKVTVPQKCHPLAKIVFAEMRRQAVTYDELEHRSGVLRSTFKAWRTNNKPGLETIELALAALGWRIAVEPIDAGESRPRHGPGHALPRPLALAEVR